MREELSPWGAMSGGGTMSNFDDSDQSAERRRDSSHVRFVLLDTFAVCGQLSHR